jgi:hypothetical protein
VSVLLDLLGFAGWPLGAFFAAVALAATRPLRARKEGGKRELRERGSWVTPLMFGCAAAADFTAIGFLPVWIGTVIAMLIFAAFLAVGRPWRKHSRRALRSNARIATRWLGEDTRRASGRIRGRYRLVRRSGDSVPSPPEEHLAAVGAMIRAVPPLREDAALGGPIAPEAIASIPAADPARVFAEWIAAHEPETDAELLAFVRSCAAGQILISHAWYAYADRCMSDLGLDPAFTAGIGEIAEHSAELANDMALVDQRFHLIYREIQDWIASGRVLPSNPRFLTGGDAA